MQNESEQPSLNGTSNGKTWSLRNLISLKVCQLRLLLLISSKWHNFSANIHIPTDYFRRLCPGITREGFVYLLRIGEMSFGRRLGKTTMKQAIKRRKFSGMPYPKLFHFFCVYGYQRSLITCIYLFMKRNRRQNEDQRNNRKKMANKLNKIERSKRTQKAMDGMPIGDGMLDSAINI